MGTLLALDSQIDTATGTIRLRAQFDNKDDALFPNQFVNARLLLNTLSDVTLVPTGAIQRSAQGAFVYVVKPDNTLEMRPVKVGITEGDLASVTGVAADETIAGGQLQPASGRHGGHPAQGGERGDSGNDQRR